MTDELIKRAEAFNTKLYKQLFNKPDEAISNDAFITHEISDDTLGFIWCLIQDLLTALKGKGWMPIADMPEVLGGEQFLMSDGEFVLPAEYTGNMFHYYNITCLPEFNIIPQFRPTHFMLLPTPPTGSEFDTQTQAKMNINEIR